MQKENSRLAIHWKGEYFDLLVESLDNSLDSLLDLMCRWYWPNRPIISRFS